MAPKETAVVQLARLVEALRVLIDSSYWENMADYQRAMSPNEREALATVHAIVQPEDCEYANPDPSTAAAQSEEEK